MIHDLDMAEHVRRQQREHLAHQQPLAPLHPDPWMSPRQWLVCAAAIVALVIWWAL